MSAPEANLVMVQYGCPFVHASSPLYTVNAYMLLLCCGYLLLNAVSKLAESLFYADATVG